MNKFKSSVYIPLDGYCFYPRHFVQQVALGFRKPYRFCRNESWHMSSKNYEKDPKFIEIMIFSQGTYINYIGGEGFCGSQQIFWAYIDGP